MSVKRTMAAACAAVLLPLMIGQAAVRADTTPPTGCTPWNIFPGTVVTCDGVIVWGAQHGTARVHNVLSVDPPQVSAGMTVTYTWAVGTTYTTGHHYYGLGWSSLGKGVYVKVLVRTRHGGFARYYNFGVVKAPA